MTQAGSVAEGRLGDWISLGVLASWVPRARGDRQPRQRPGHEPVREVFAQVARPVDVQRVRYCSW